MTKIKTWMSDGWICVLVDDGVSKATVSLDADETALLLRSLTDAVGTLPENGAGTKQGFELNRAYSNAADLLATP